MNGQAQQDLALDRLEAANLNWIEQVVSHVAFLVPGTLFTTDDLWFMLPSLPEPRAMGAAMRRVRRLGLALPTGTYRKSGRTENHARPVLVWERQ